MRAIQKKGFCSTYPLHWRKFGPRLPPVNRSIRAGEYVILHEVAGNSPVGAIHYTASATVSKDVPGYSKGDRIALEVAPCFQVRQDRITEIRELVVKLT